MPLVTRPATSLWSIFSGSGSSQKYFAQYATVEEVEAKSSRIKIRRIWKTSVYIEGCVTLRTVALRHPIFEQKKSVCRPLV
jgi:hypothetical protein